MTKTSEWITESHSLDIE